MTTTRRLIIRIADRASKLLPASLKQWLYRTPWLARFARRILNASVPEGFSEITIAAGILQGCRMSLDLKKEKDYWLGTYEPDLQDAAHRFIQPGMVVYDVGANIGYISLICARLCGEQGRVYAFEALPANLERLKAQVRLNQWTGRILPIQAAIIDRSGVAIFLAHSSGAMGKARGSAGRDEHYKSEIQVEGLALDDFVFQKQNPPPQVIKMDIEGGEGLALTGMRRILKEVRPVLLIELHGRKAASQVWERLSSSQYGFHRMQKDLLPVVSLDQLDWKAYLVAIPQ